MPKKAKSDEEWNRRLREYAKGLKFSTGEAPRKDSHWHAKVESINRCPITAAGPLQKSLFSTKVLPCNCGYHESKKKTFSVSPAALDKSKQRMADREFKMKLFSESSESKMSSADGSSVECKKKPVVPATTTCMPAEIEPASTESLAPTAAGSSTSESIALPHPTTPPATTSLHTDTSATAPTTAPSAPTSSAPRHQFVSNISSVKLPGKWKQQLTPAECTWLKKALYKPDGSMDLTRLWYQPPSMTPLPDKKPEVEKYFFKSFFAWRPRRMWQVCFKCPLCSHGLTSKGWYGNIRTVLGMSEYYYLISEYLECHKCSKAWPAHSSLVINQLEEGLRLQFPAVLTHKNACDLEVCSLFRSRTLGNSTTSILNSIRERHTEDYLRKCSLYLTHCQMYKKCHIKAAMNSDADYFSRPPALEKILDADWGLRVLTTEAVGRLPETKAAITSCFGSILKLDSTKKVIKKLAGEAAGTATWCTNVGNEFGEVLISVLTVTEGIGLQRMAQGLVKRYEAASVEPPRVLYVDRGCCRVVDGDCMTKELFKPWPTEVKLDIFHFMRRFSLCTTTEAHPCYGLFMGRLSAAIFEWDSDDLELLRRAKSSELKSSGISAPSQHQIDAAITKNELAKHCRRRTRGVDQTIKLISSLLSESESLFDTLGTPLINTTKAAQIWSEQQKHISCIQDPDDLQLYTKVSTLSKGGVQLPVYRCARGSSSLESFHLHLARFIPGSSASAEHWQMYLLEGLQRWNSDRRRALYTNAITRFGRFHTYNLRTMVAVNHLSNEVFGESILDAPKPLAYTGELIGLEYLLNQTDTQLNMDSIDETVCQAIDSMEDTDEGFDELDVIDPTVMPLCVDGPTANDKVVLTTPPQQEEMADPELCVDQGDIEDEGSTKDMQGIEGMEVVDRITSLLIEGSQTETSLTFPPKINCDLKKLSHLLNPYDKKVRYHQRVGDNPTLGNLRITKMSSSVTPQANSTKRALLGTGLPAQHPNCSRIVEQLCIKLMELYRSPLKKTLTSTYVPRYERVLKRYRQIREMVLQSHQLSQSDIVLVNLNQTTLSQWYTKRNKAAELKLLKQNVSSAFDTFQTSATALPEASSLPGPSEKLPVGDDHVIDMVTESTAGQAALKRKCHSVQTADEPALQLSTSAKYRRLQEDRLDQATGQERRRNKRCKPYTCSVCTKPKTKETGHRRHTSGAWYCPENKQSYEEWMAAITNSSA